MNELKNLKKDSEMIGQKFSRLSVIKYAGKDGHGSTTWKCLCDCGKTKIIVGYSLKRGNTRSCGCFRTELLANRKLTGFTEKKLRDLYISQKLTIVEIAEKLSVGPTTVHNRLIEHDIKRRTQWYGPKKPHQKKTENKWSKTHLKLINLSKSKVNKPEAILAKEKADKIYNKHLVCRKVCFPVSYLDELEALLSVIIGSQIIVPIKKRLENE